MMKIFLEVSYMSNQIPRQASINEQHISLIPNRNSQASSPLMAIKACV